MLHTIKERNVQLSSENKTMAIRPLLNWQTALAFGIPALVMLVSFHWGMPWLQTVGLTPFESMIVTHTVPMALLLTSALVMIHKIDGYPLGWKTLSQRFRYPRLTLKAILQGLGLFIAIMLGYGLFNGLNLLLIEQGWLPVPDGLPALLDPHFSLTSAALDNMVGGQILGNWRVVVLYAIMLFFNIVGEELWWRGYILPRQEKRYGRFTWVWHGLLWTSFHTFIWWDMIGLLPVCLGIAYVSQRTKNNWPAFIAHLLFNGLALVGIIMATVTTIG